MNNRKCKCNCPHGDCEHDWTEENIYGVCRECGVTWADHHEEIYDREVFRNLQRIMKLRRVK
jgi:hypothetical protein